METSASFAPDQWRLPLILLASIAGLVISLARVVAFERELTRTQRLIVFLYEAAYWIAWIATIGPILFRAS